jgi:hypothetical protein
VQLCGQGYRLDHSPLLFKQVQGSEGFSLHGGPLTEQGAWNPLLSYQFNHGRMYNTLLACSVQLTSTHAGDGGFCIVKGSHKSNFVCPPEMVVRTNRVFARRRTAQPSQAVCVRLPASRAAPQHGLLSLGRRRPRSLLLCNDPSTARASLGVRPALGAYRRVWVGWLVPRVWL